jgi:hypothetical protein
MTVWLKRLRTGFGESPAGPCWRAVKGALARMLAR